MGLSFSKGQRDYPQYRELVDDLTKVNKQLVQYAAVIKQIAQGSNAVSAAEQGARV